MVEEVFKLYDENDSGSLDLNELKLAFPSLKSRELKEFFKECDTDGDKSISFQELKHYLTHRYQ